jgi:hypothetical protein
MADRGDLLVGPGGGFRSHDSMIARAKRLSAGERRPQLWAAPVQRFRQLIGTMAAVVEPV